MATRHYLSLLLLLALCCPAAGVRAQYIKRESLPTAKKNASGKAIYQDFAVFYADGMPASAQWPIGNINSDQYGRTSRHQVNQGNGTNRNVNNKIPARFIISPVDAPIGGNMPWGPGNCLGQWSYAASIDQNPTVLQQGTSNAAPNTGCYWFSGGGNGGTTNANGKYTNRKWRVPTQREAMLMLLFEDAINTIYGTDPTPSKIPANGVQLESSTPQGMNGKIYWTSTEEPDTPGNTGTAAPGSKAWVVDFSRKGNSDGQVIYPASKTDQTVTQTYRLRCVSDY